MNKIALHSFSSFDIAKNASDDDASDRFYHGFVLGLTVELLGRFEITSNRESGFGSYNVMLALLNRGRNAVYIIEFKVHKPTKVFSLDQIRKYGFAFQGKKFLIG